MDKFNQDEFNSFIAENNVYGFFDEAITLKSGRKSHFYVNWREIVEDVYLTAKLAEYVIAFVSDNRIEVDTFYGVPEGATKLGIITQYQWAQKQSIYRKGSHILAMGRAKPKEHGAPKDKYFVGMPKGRVLVMEDATTTGGSALKSIEKLREAGIDICGLLILTNRMEKRDDGLSVKEAVEKAGINFYCMSTAIDLLPIMFNKLNPGEKIGRAIEAEFDQYGVDRVSLTG